MEQIARTGGKYFVVLWNNLGIFGKIIQYNRESGKSWKNQSEKG